MVEKKLFAGPRLKRLRKSLGLTQVKMAAALGVSASYLNLMERNQRPISARVLIRLAETFDFDLKSFAAAPDQSTILALREAAANPVLAELALDLQDLKDLADSHPRAARALLLLHNSHQGTASHLASLADRLDDGQSAARADASPWQAVDQALQAQGNYFAGLETAAEALAEDARLDRTALEAGLRGFLMQVHGVRTRILPADVMRDSLRRYDRHSRRLFLNERLDDTSRRFALAVQTALLEQRELLDQLSARAGLESRLTRRLYRLALARYFAAALIMPYAPFLQSATALRHDLHHLARRFGARVEQVCQRLTHLRRPGVEGVNFFLLRADVAGNIIRRTGDAHFPFAQTGGACSRLALWRTPGRCGRIVAQTIALEASADHILLTMALPGEQEGLGHQDAAPRLFMLGCPAEAAEALVYTAGKNGPGDQGVVPAGLNCRLCGRAECAERAFAPLNKRLHADEHRHSVLPYAFGS